MEQEDKENIKKIRAFIAATIPDHVKERVGELVTLLKREGSGVKWVRPSSMHLTLRFLGNISEEQVELAGQAMEKAVKNKTPISVSVGGWGTFPRNKRPRVIWLGLREGGIGLSHVFDSLEPELLARGFGPADKKFSPHLTLGRIKSGKGVNRVLETLESEGDAGFGGYRVDHITLFQSQLRPEGAVYTALRQSRFGGA